MVAPPGGGGAHDGSVVQTGWGRGGPFRKLSLV